VASSRSIIVAASAAEKAIQVAFVMVLEAVVGCMGSSRNGTISSVPILELR
jgi:hypothetical protein